MNSKPINPQGDLPVVTLSDKQILQLLNDEDGVILKCGPNGSAEIFPNQAPASASAETPPT